MNNRVEADNVAHSDAGSQPKVDHSARISCVVISGILCSLIALAIIAGTIVLSLIPTFLAENNISPVSNRDKALVSVNYATDLSGGSVLTVRNLDGISKKLNQILGLGGNQSDVISARFVSTTASGSSGRRKRLTDQPSCATNSELQGEMLRLEFGVTYPKACRSTSCRTKFLADVQNTIQKITEVLQLSITFDNGQSVELKLQFCSFSTTPPVTSKCTFSTGKSYSTGTGSFPRGLAVNDIDGNGNVDIIVTNTAADNITVLLNSGGGVFPVQLTSKTDHGYSPYSLAAVDMNGDGQVDVIVANSAGDNIGVVLNKGDGTFGEQVIYSMAAGSTPHSVVAADVNGDGKPDVIVANSGADNVAVLMNSGNGALGAPVTYSLGTGSSPRSVAMADVNSDGKADVIVANYGTNNVGVLLNSGSGTFSTPVSYSTGSGSSPASVAVGDVNSDNKPDIIVANSGSDTIGVLLNSGSGAFSTQTTYSTGSGSSVMSVAVADVNSDGKRDVIVANYGSDTAGVFLNKGNGIFAPQASYLTGVGSSPVSVVVADVNGDRKPDIVVANYGVDSIIVFLAC